jgi:hypothetical protein
MKNIIISFLIFISLLNITIVYFARNDEMIYDRIAQINDIDIPNSLEKLYVFHVLLKDSETTDEIKASIENSLFSLKSINRDFLQSGYFDELLEMNEHFIDAMILQIESKGINPIIEYDFYKGNTRLFTPLLQIKEPSLWLYLFRHFVLINLVIVCATLIVLMYYVFVRRKNTSSN